MYSLLDGCLIYHRLSDSATEWETVISHAENEHTANWPSVVYSLCYHPDLLQQNSARASTERVTKRPAQNFEQYVQSVLKRYLNRTVSLVQIFSSLVWLAQQMQYCYLTEFQMESLQAH